MESINGTSQRGQAIIRKSRSNCRLVTAGEMGSSDTGNTTTTTTTTTTNNRPSQQKQRSSSQKSESADHAAFDTG
jgi:hypothetical protein